MDDSASSPTGLSGYFLPVPSSAPRPPYQDRGGSQLYLCGNLPPGVGTQVLPHGLTATPDRNVFIALGTTPEGWGLSPFNGCCIGMAVQGHDAPDGSPGVFLFAGTFSGRAGQILPRDYCALFQAGEVDFSHERDRVRAAAPLPGGGRVAASAEVGPEGSQSMSGTMNYLGVDATGGLICFVQGYAMRCAVATDVALDVTLPNGHPMGFLREFTLDRALWIFDRSSTFGPPTRLSQPVLPALLTQLDRAVVLVDDMGHILLLSPEAEALLTTAGATRPRILREFAALATTPHTADVRTRASTLVTLPDGGQIIATVLPHPPGATAILLLTDPRQPGPADPVPLLRLMGLTPAEAALAALIGTGSTPSAAAAVRGITEGTARSTLKIIFSKLGLHRTADLAQIVTRLQMG